MTISFNSIPTNLRVPFVTAEFDSSRSSQGAAVLAYKALLVGQKITAGTATADTIVKCSNANQAAVAAGRGSILHRQALAWFASNKFTDLYLGVLADNGAGVAATKTVTLTGTATAAGTLSVYVGLTPIQVAVAVGDVAATVATALNAAINLAIDLPFTSGVASAVVTLTARNKGTAGQDWPLRVNYQDGEAVPAGLTAVVANVVAGITNPTLTNLIAAMGDNWYNVISAPYYDATSLSALETELASRFGPTRMIDGQYITSAVGTQGTLSSLGLGRNSPFTEIWAPPGRNPLTPPAEFAAETAAIIAASASIDPARAFQTLAYSWARPPVDADLFTFTERNSLLYAGISTSKAASGRVQIERAITTYQTNAAGGADVAYLDATTMFNLMYLRYSWRAQNLSKYPRHKLAADGTRFGAGQAVVTPKGMRGEALLWFRQMETLGLVEGFDQFKTDLVVERNASDPNRMDVLLSPDLINNLLVTANKIQFLF